MVAATLALAVVGGAAWVTGSDSTDRGPGPLLVRVNDDTDTVEVFGLDGTLQRTVQLPDDTVGVRAVPLFQGRSRTLVFWNGETTLLTRVDPMSGEMTTLDLPATSEGSLAWLTTLGVLVLQYPYQPPVVVDTTVMRVIDVAATLPAVTLQESARPFQEADTALLLADEPPGMMMFPADSPSHPWFADGLIVALSAEGAVSWDQSGGTVRMLAATGQVGKTISLPLDDGARIGEWTSGSFSLTSNDQQSVWQLDFAEGLAVQMNNELPGVAILLPHDRMVVRDRGAETVTLYDLSGAVVAAFTADSVVDSGSPIDLSGRGTDCRALSLVDRESSATGIWTTAVIELETGEVVAALPGELRHQSSDGCSLVTSDRDGTHAFSGGRTTELGDDVEFDPEMDWAVEETEEGDFLVDLTTGERTELPPGEGSYVFIEPATGAPQNRT